MVVTESLTVLKHDVLTSCAELRVVAQSSPISWAITAVLLFAESQLLSYSPESKKPKVPPKKDSSKLLPKWPLISQFGSSDSSFKAKLRGSDFNN